MSQGLCSPSYMMPSNLEAAIAWAELMSIGTKAENACSPFSNAPIIPFSLAELFISPLHVLFALNFNMPDASTQTNPSEDSFSSGVFLLRTNDYNWSNRLLSGDRHGAGTNTTRHKTGRD